MQYCAEIVLKTIFHQTSIVSRVHHCVDIILVLLLALLLCRICRVCGIYCEKIAGLMYSFHKTHLLKRNQMIGHLHRGVVHSKGVVISKFKRSNNKKNNRWHFNRIFTGQIQTSTVAAATTMTTMWNNAVVMMSGKLKKKRNYMMKQYVEKLK